MFGSRAAKTTFCLGAMLFTSHTAPAPMMLTSATRDMVTDTVSERTWKMADAAGVFGTLPPERRRSKRRMRLPGCVWNTGWAENARTLADKTAKILHKGEVDKWRWLRGTKEADPFNLADERAKEWPDRKILNESTPATAGVSHIEAAFLRGWGCYYFVPCPLCGKYQQINLGKGGPGGIRFEKEEGRRNAMLAYRTACYICRFCEGSIGEDARPKMMRRGVWVPAGCDVDHDGATALFHRVPDGVTHHREDLPAKKRKYRWEGWENASWVRGKPTRGGTIASYQLSTLYSLMVGWNDVAKAWIEAQQKPGGLQNFVNSWLGETWRDPRKHNQEWEALGRKLIWKVPHGKVPADCSMITVGIDRQADHLVFVVLAFAPGRKPAVIDYGELPTLEDAKRLLLSNYPHEDGGPGVAIARAFIDVGFHPSDETGTTVHQWIRDVQAEARRQALQLVIKACRGANHPLGRMLKEAPMKEGHAPGAALVEVDHPHTQDWINMLLHGRPSLGVDAAKPQGETPPPVDEVLLRIFNGSIDEHEDFLKQIVNDGPEDEVEKRTNNVKRVWKRLDEGVPNDYRDGTRYALAAFWQQIRNGLVPTRAQRVHEQQAVVVRPRTESGGRFTSPTGQRFFVGNRK